MPRSKGLCEVMGIMDDHMGKVKLAAMEDRKGETVTDIILDRVVFETGTPLRLHSDDAKELTGTVMRGFAKALGIKRTTTLGYNPRGNAKMERFWLYFVRCLRKLTKEQYKNWPRHLSSIAWAWNIAYKEEMGCSSFEIEHGMKPRTAVDAMFTERNPQAGAPVNIAGQLAATALAYRQLAKTNREYHRRLRAEMLRNQRVRAPARYNVGDRVKYFSPPSAEEAQRLGRKSKHSFLWRGPATVKRILSSQAYVLHDILRDRDVSRTVINIRPYRSTSNGETKGVTFDIDSDNDGDQDASFATGEVVAVIERADDKLFFLGKILTIENDDITVHYYGTRGKNISTAKFFPTFQITGGRDKGQFRIGNLRPRRNMKACTGVFHIDDTDELFLARRLSILDSARVAAASAKKLKKLKRKHSVLK